MGLLDFADLEKLMCLKCILTFCVYSHLRAFFPSQQRDIDYWTWENASRIESLEQEKVDDEEEGKKDESSCSSEEDEEDDSESEAETGKFWRIEGFSENFD